MRVCILIDDWEGRVVNQCLAIGHGDSRINHYWMVQNMLGNLMEDMLSNWSADHDTVLAVEEKMAKLDGHLSSMIW